MKQLFRLEKKPIRGLLWVEWAIIVYAVLTAVYILVFREQLHAPGAMLWGRAQAVLMMLALWGVYRLLPCRLTLLCRVLAQLMMLGWWYPDTFELNRIQPNLDHVFAQAEQSLFGFQPALTFYEQCSSPVVSELLTLGYVSYYPMIGAIVLFYFFCRFERFLRTSFVVLASFFLFYIVFVLLPVAGPQYYYPAVGLDQIAQGIFPAVGNYFADIDLARPGTMMSPPGWKDGLFYHLLIDAHEAGERPTAAFPSSHVGITTIVMWLAWETRQRRLFITLLPFSVLMFFATFYIYAHYAIDAIAGLFAGTAMYFGFSWLYTKLPATP